MSSNVTCSLDQFLLETNKQTNVALLNDESEQTERKIWEKICHIYTTIAFLCFILGLRLTPQSVGRNWGLLVVYAAVGVEFLQWTENWALALWSGHMEAWRCMSSSAALHPVARRQDWFWTRSAGCQAWQQSPQPTEPCCWHLRSSYSFLLARREDSLSTGLPGRKWPVFWDKHTVKMAQENSSANTNTIPCYWNLWGHLVVPILETGTCYIAQAGLILHLPVSH